MQLGKKFQFPFVSYLFSPEAIYRPLVRTRHVQLSRGACSKTRKSAADLKQFLSWGRFAQAINYNACRIVIDIDIFKLDHAFSKSRTPRPLIRDQNSYGRFFSIRERYASNPTCIVLCTRNVSMLNGTISLHCRVLQREIVKKCWYILPPPFSPLFPSSFLLFYFLFFHHLPG